LIVGLKKNQEANKLLQLISNESGSFNGVNYGTAWNCLSTMKKHHARINNDPRFKKFIADTAKAITQDIAGERVDVRNHANIIHAVAKLRPQRSYPNSFSNNDYADSITSITSAMLAKGEWIMETGDQQNVANMCWAFATLGIQASSLSSLFAIVDKRGEWLMEKGDPQLVANTCWAFAKLNIKAPSLFDAVDSKGQWLVENAKPQEVANMCWAFATLGVQAPTLLGAADKRGQWLVNEGTSQAVANTSWAFAVLGVQAPSLFEAVENNRKWLAYANSQEIANTSWAFATLGVHAFSFFADVDKRGPALVANGTPHNIANTCWAFAKLGIRGSTLFNAVDKRGQWLTENGTSQAVATTCWAFATFGIRGSVLFDAVDIKGQWLMGDCKSQDFANMCWAFATLGVEARGLIEAVNERGQWLVKNGNPQEVTTMCWAAVIAGELGEGELIRTCWKAAMQIPPHTLSVQALTQLHEIELCVQIEGSEELRSSLDEMPREMRAAVDEAVGEIANLSSRRQSEVSALLTEMGFAHENEVSPFPSDNGNNYDQQQTFMAIDIACRNKMIAIEFNGPSHYNTDNGQPNGKTAMKKRLLEKMGWRHHGIHWGEFKDLKTKNEKVEYLRGMLG
jgi:hypothetical protein